MIEPLSFEISTELSPADYNQILRFVREYYLLVRPDVFGEVRLGDINGSPALTSSMFGHEETARAWHKSMRIEPNFTTAKAVPSTLDDSVEAVVDSGERVHVTVPIREGLPMAVLEIL